MIREETSIAEKIIKLFPHEDIVLNKKINNRKPDIWFTNYNIIIWLLRLMKETMKIMTQMMKKKREDMLKKNNFKIFWCNPNDPEFDLFKFQGEINLYTSTLREENAANKANNKAINKVAEDFKKIVSVAKLKELKRYVKNILPNYKKMKNLRSKIKPIKIG